MSQDRESIVVINGTEYMVHFFSDKHQYQVNGKYVPSSTTIIGLMDKSHFLINWAVNLAVSVFNTKAVKSCIKVCLENGKKVFLGIDEDRVNKIQKLAKEEHKTVRDSKGEIGTLIHSCIENMVLAIMEGLSDKQVLETLPTNLPKSYKKAMEKFLEWQKDFTWTYTEHIVYSAEWSYIGTTDLVGVENSTGKSFTFDVKTSPQIYDSFYLQLASYAIGLEEMYPESDEFSRGIIKINPKTGHFKVHILPEVRTITSKGYKRQVSREDDFMAFIYLRGLYRCLRGI